MTESAVSEGGAAPPSVGPTGQEAEVVLALHRINKHFGGVHAVVDVSLHLRRGEVVALVGNNGAGKSTTMNIISGVFPPDSGHFEVLGHPVYFRGPRHARALGIESVPQELALAKHLSVAANMYLGREITKGWGPLRILDKRTMRRKSEELIESFGIQIPNLAARVFDLSGGQQQGVAIGRALAWGSRLVVLDEPTAALGVHETSRIEHTIRQMSAGGVAVLLVSHNLDQVFRVSDRIYVLRRGRLVGERVTKETSEPELVSLITGLGVTGVDGPSLGTEHGAKGAQ